MHKAMMSSREVRCSARWRLTTRSRPFIASGGLVSYGDNPLDSYRLTGAYGPHPQGRKAVRPYRAAGNEARAIHQSDSREDARHRRSASPLRPCRRGDRIAIRLLRRMSPVLGPISDICPLILL